MSRLLGLTSAGSAAEALQHAVLKSVLFVLLYLCAVTLLHRSLEPLLRVFRLLREMVPGDGRASRWPGYTATSSADASAPAPSEP